MGTGSKAIDESKWPLDFFLFPYMGTCGVCLLGMVSSMRFFLFPYMGTWRARERRFVVRTHNLSIPLYGNKKGILLMIMSAQDGFLFPYMGTNPCIISGNPKYVTISFLFPYMGTLSGGMWGLSWVIPLCFLFPYMGTRQADHFRWIYFSPRFLFPYMGTTWFATAWLVSA